MSWFCIFFSETNRLDHGLILELWTKGVLWDKLLGLHFISLHQVQYSAGPGLGKWLQIDQELETRNGEPIGTSKPTGHSLLVDVRFELPFGKLLFGQSWHTSLSSFLLLFFGELTFLRAIFPFFTIGPQNGTIISRVCMHVVKFELMHFFRISIYFSWKAFAPHRLNELDRHFANTIWLNFNFHGNWHFISCSNLLPYFDRFLVIAVDTH